MAFEIRIKEVNGNYATSGYHCVDMNGQSVKLRPGQTVVVTDLDMHIDTGKVELVKRMRRERTKSVD